MALIPQDEFGFDLNHEITVQPPRDYLGLSQIGHTCHRYLQHYHYWTFTSEISDRLQRLFNVGHMMEPAMIDALSTKGIHVTGEQTGMVGAGGHWKGHCDGIAIAEANPGVQFLVEFKTHNEKSFALLKKNGLDSKTMHIDQMQAYMGYLKLPYALYMAYSKNTSEYWLKTMQFDEDRFIELKRKEVEIISSDVMLPRIGNGSPSWFECKFCDAREVCFGRKPVEKTCRSCYHVDVLDEGKWSCTHSDKPGSLNSDTQREACGYYDLGGMFK